MSSPNFIEPHPETSASLDYLANHDLKALSFVALVELEEGTITDVGKAVAAHTQPEMRNPAEGYPLTFAKADFATVRRGIGAHGRPANFYAATRTDNALKVIGTGFEWSEIHNFPLATMLSTTASRSQSCAPTNTIQLLDGLQRGLTVASIGLPGYKPYEGQSTVHNTRFKNLVKIGIVEAHDEPIITRILDPSYKGNKPFQSLRPGRQAFYRTVTLAKDLRPDARWGIEELEALAKKFGFVNDENQADFHATLTLAVSSKTEEYSPGVLERQDLKPRAYSLSDRYAEMVSDLIERVAIVDSSLSFAAEARNYAFDAYRDPAVALRIAERGLIHSPHRKFAASNDATV